MLPQGWLVDEYSGGDKNLCRGGVYNFDIKRVRIPKRRKRGIGTDPQIGDS